MRSIIAILLVLVGLSHSMPNGFFRSPIEGDKFEGDITFEQGRTLATMENLGVSYWPNGVVAYVLQESFIGIYFLPSLFVFFVN